MEKIIYKFLLLFILLALSCFNPFTSDDTDNYTTPGPDRTTAAGCIEYMRQAYENKDIDKYMECFASDFIHYLLPDDFFYEGNKYITHWDRTEEERRAREAFEKYSKITFELTADPDGHDEQCNGETLRVFNKSFRLTVYLKESEGDVQGYTSNGTITFKLRQCATMLWEIVEWDDGSDVSRCFRKTR